MSAVAVCLSSPALAGDRPASDAAHFGAWGVDLSARDTSVPPGDDFFSYAQGGWYAGIEIPADQTSVDTFTTLSNRTQEHLRGLVEAAAKDPQNGSVRQIGDLYESFMDEALVERLDAAPLGPDLARFRWRPASPEIGRGYFEPDSLRPEFRPVGLGVALRDERSREVRSAESAVAWRGLVGRRAVGRGRNVDALPASTSPGSRR